MKTIDKYQFNEDEFTFEEKSKLKLIQFKLTLQLIPSLRGNFP